MKARNLHGDAPPLGLYGYPVLMAADILLYKLVCMCVIHTRVAIFTILMGEIQWLDPILLANYPKMTLPAIYKEALTLA